MKDVQKAVAFGLYEGVVMATPVDTGRARGNWNINVGEVDPSVDENKTSPQYQTKDQIADTNGDEAIYISNNLPYIAKLEYGGYPDPVKKGTWVKNKNGKGGHYEKRSSHGYSKRAPNGMVGITMARTKEILDKAIAEVKSGL